MNSIVFFLPINLMVCRSCAYPKFIAHTGNVSLNLIRERSVVDTLNQRLKTLIAEACTYPAKSLERRERLSEVHRLVMNSGKLWRTRDLYYNDALQEMWEFCCQNPELYNPEVQGVITWLDDYLKKRLRRFRYAKTRQLQREITALVTEAGDTLDPIATLPARPDIQPVLEIWEKTQTWIESGLLPEANLSQSSEHQNTAFQPELHAKLCSTCFRGCDGMNCQALVLRRLPPEIPWAEIAIEFALNPAESKDLPKFYNRRCLPLLREFAALQGYLELDRAQRRKSL